MRATHRSFRRAGSVVAAAAAISIAGATVASAHHCYKDVWTDAAYQHLSAGGTAWMPLSDLGTAFLIGPEYAEQCGYVADDVVADWMTATGATQEPLIHIKATIGGGAFYVKGKAPQPISYLGEQDFEMLTVGIIEGMADCAPDWTPPAMG